MMTVSELVRELGKMDPRAVVSICSPCGSSGTEPVTRVEPPTKPNGPVGGKDGHKFQWGVVVIVGD